MMTPVAVGGQGGLRAGLSVCVASNFVIIWQVLRVCEMVRRGIGVHHGGMLPILKEGQCWCSYISIVCYVDDMRMYSPASRVSVMKSTSPLLAFLMRKNNT